MKNLVFFLFVAQLSLAQSITITPVSGNDNDVLRINKSGIGLSHEFGISKVGTYATASGGYIQTHSNHPLFFSTNNGSAYMTLSTAGDFGIGTSTPTAKLHVVGTIKNSALAGTGTRPVMADANGILISGNSSSNSIAFSAYQGAAQSLSSSVSTKLLLDTEHYDISNNFNTSTNEFTVPIDGIYHFDANCTISTGTNTSGAILLELKSNGNTLAQTTTEIHASADYNTNIISKDIKLVAGQIVNLAVFNSASTTLNIINTAPPYYICFSGHLVLAL